MNQSKMSEIVKRVIELPSKENYQFNISILPIGNRYLCAFRQTVNGGYYFGKIRFGS